MNGHSIGYGYDNSNHSAGYNKNIINEEHFDYVLIDKNSNEPLIKFNNELKILSDVLNKNVIIKGIEYIADDSSCNGYYFNGHEIELKGRIIKKSVDIALANLNSYFIIKGISPVV